MTIKHKMYSWILMLLIVMPSIANAQLLGSFEFKNMSIGFGMNSTEYDFEYFQIDDYFNNDLKQSFLIDVRANFYGPHDWIVSPTFELWSWTDNSGNQFDAVQNGVNDYMFSLDATKLYGTHNSFNYYFGGGVGLHFLTYFTNFPLMVPFFQNGTFRQIQNITIRTSLITPNLIAGFKFKLWEDFLFLPR